MALINLRLSHSDIEKDRVLVIMANPSTHDVVFASRCFRSARQIRRNINRLWPFPWLKKVRSCFIFKNKFVLGFTKVKRQLQNCFSEVDVKHVTLPRLPCIWKFELSLGYALLSACSCIYAHLIILPG